MQIYVIGVTPCVIAFNALYKKHAMTKCQLSLKGGVSKSAFWAFCDRYAAGQSQKVVA
jgi:hypothetical protein